MSVETSLRFVRSGNPLIRGHHVGDRREQLGQEQLVEGDTTPVEAGIGQHGQLEVQISGRQRGRQHRRTGGCTGQNDMGDVQ